jgi:hypothetical protein
MAATRFFTPAQLKVFDQLPADEVNTRIQELFVPKAKPPPEVQSEEGRKQWRDRCLAELKVKTFGGWPAQEPPLELRRVFSARRAGVRLEAFDFTSQSCIRLRLYVAQGAGGARPKRVVLNVADEQDWRHWLAAMQTSFAGELREEMAVSGGNGQADEQAFADLKRQLTAERTAMAWIAPRGIGMSAWTTNAAKVTQIRRRFMLLGQTLDGMRVWDIRRAGQAMRALPGFDRPALALAAHRQMAVNALYAALFEPRIARLDLADLPPSHAEGPDYLNVLRIWDLPEALEVAKDRGEVEVR